MTAMILDADADDDFVRTISDNDESYLLVSDEYEEKTETSLGIPRKGAKRKRKVAEEPAARPSKKQSRSLDPDGSRGILSQEANKDQGSDEETWDAQGEDDGAIDSDFEFQIGTADSGVKEDFDGWGEDDFMKISTSQKPGDNKGVDIDELIERRRKAKNGDKAMDGANKYDREKAEVSTAESDEEQDLEVGDGVTGKDLEEDEDETTAEDAFGMGATVEDLDSVLEGDGDETNEDLVSESEDEAIADPMPNPEYLEDVSDEEADQEEFAKRKAFFAPEEPVSKETKKDATFKAFQSMSLSRPILRGLASVGFNNPTPIQNKTIPVALLGKDVVGGAVTGSGKTGAFIIPVLERLLYRPKKVPTSRVAILMPTRELAVQCFNVAKKLASFTDISFALLIGGFSLREQESVLRSRPDILIATPGRFIDHMRNSASFTVDTLEILVLDEADRMLEDGFSDELNEILATIPKSRQTMLFSATMTDRVDKLIRVGLNRPVRLMVDAKKQTVVTLTQEFVRLRPGREDKRIGYLTHLCSNIFSDRVIIFFRQKKEAHRVRIIFGLLGIKAAELHGSMSQEQRISSLTYFRNGHATHLLATDLASRGLDIPKVSVVINYEAPQSHEIYLHRVGRTARAGRGGRACTIAAECDRKVVKQAVKAAKVQGAKIVSRVIEPGVADEWAAKLATFDDEVNAILEDEKEEKLLSQTDMVIRKGENIIQHEDEIHSRPKRTWFESEKEKLKAKKAGQEELNGRVGLGKKVGGKLSNKERKALDDKRERKEEGMSWKKGKGDAKATGKDKGGMGKSKGKAGAGRRGARMSGGVGGRMEGKGDGVGGRRPKR